MVAAPAVYRVVERRALIGGLRAHARQPLAVGVPTLLLVGTAPLRISGATVLRIQRGTELMRFVLAHRLLTIPCRRRARLRREGGYPQELNHKHPVSRACETKRCARF